jgi:hypothetical protein
VGVVIKLRFDICWHARRFSTNKEEFQHSSFKVSFQLMNFLMCCKSKIEVQNVCKVVKNISKFCTFVLIRRNCGIKTPKWRGP